jgi:lipoprotein-releasing system permease protein
VSASRQNDLTAMVTLRFLFGRRNDPGSRNYTFRRVRGGVLGIALSLIPLVVVFVVANGMISGITVRFLETGTYHLQLVSRTDTGLAAMEPLISEIRTVDGVRSAVPEIRGLALLAGGAGHNGVQIRGIDPSMYAADPGFSRYLELTDGEFDLESERSILVGEYMASQLGIVPGDQVRIITARAGSAGRSLPRVSRFTVRGIVSSGYRELDSLWVFMSAADALRVIPPGEAREMIGIKIDDPFSVEPSAASLGFVRLDREQDTAAGITEAPAGGPVDGAGSPAAESPLLTRIRGIIDGNWRLYSWFELERSQYMSFITTRNLLLFIMVLIVLVAAVNISSAMIMLVLEKQEEIAMLKAMGWENRNILAVFIGAGAVTGVLGTLIGLSLGSLAAYNVNLIILLIEKAINALGYAGAILFNPGEGYIPLQLFNPDFYLSSIPVEMKFGDIAIMGAVSVALSLIMSVLPARRAVKTSPLKLLHRH